MSRWLCAGLSSRRVAQLRTASFLAVSGGERTPMDALSPVFAVVSTEAEPFERDGFDCQIRNPKLR